MDRIVVVLPNWYGETLFATPFLRVLRARHPDASITTMGWPRCREMLLYNPALNDMLDYDERGAHRSLWGAWPFVRTLRARRFDAAYILRRSLTRSLLLFLAGVRQRIGFDNAKSGWLLTRRVPMPSGPLHKAASYLPLLSADGAALPLSPYEYFVGEEERQAAAERLRAQGLLDGRPMVVLHPGANWPHKRWAPERFAALGDRLAEAQPRHLVVTGGPGDAALADAIRRSMRAPVTVLAGEMTVRELGACLADANLVVSNDTGVLHIAAALRRPVVALYGPTSPTLTGPLGDPGRTVVLHHADCCPQIPCYHPDQPAHPGMDAITVDEAFTAANQLLERVS